MSSNTLDTLNKSTNTGTYFVINSVRIGLIWWSLGDSTPKRYFYDVRGEPEIRIHGKANGVLCGVSV
jgi:hypothetical protein